MQTYAQYPQLGLSTTPFVISSVKTYAALTKPYEIPSKQYNADYNETKTYGSKNSTARTQYQTDTGGNPSTNISAKPYHAQCLVSLSV